MSRARRSSRGFTLIEALVALAVVAAVLSSIGYAIASAVRGTRMIAQRIVLAGVAEDLVAGLAARDGLAPGRQSGRGDGYEWRIDVAPIAPPREPQQPLGNALQSPGNPQQAPGNVQQAVRWMPLAVNLRLQAANGAELRLTTVRLVREPAR